MDKLHDLLDKVRAATSREDCSLDDIKLALEDMLSWLVANNTDENCRRVDLFILMQIGDREKSKLPKSYQEVLFDLGGSLHDTHTAPQVARNFGSTPEQLLERVRKL